MSWRSCRSPEKLFRLHPLFPEVQSMAEAKAGKFRKWNEMDSGHRWWQLHTAAMSWQVFVSQMHLNTQILINFALVQNNWEGDWRRLSDQPFCAVCLFEALCSLWFETFVSIERIRGTCACVWPIDGCSNWRVAALQTDVFLMADVCAMLPYAIYWCLHAVFIQFMIIYRFYDSSKSLYMFVC